MKTLTTLLAVGVATGATALVLLAIGVSPPQPLSTALLNLPAAVRHSRSPATALKTPSPALKGKVLGVSTTHTPQPAPQGSPTMSAEQVTALINQTLQQDLDAGKFIGPQGEQGPQGPAGSSVVQNNNGQTTAVIGGNPIVTYVPSNSSQNFSGASEAGFTELSSNNLTTQTQTISGLLTGSSANLSGPLSVGGSTSLATTTAASLTVTGPATLQGAATLAGLSASGATQLATSTISSLTVTGPSTLSSSLLVSGSVTLATATVWSLSVSSSSTLQTLTFTLATGTAITLGQLSVNGPAVLGTTTIAQLTVTASSTLATTTIANLTLAAALPISSGGTGTSTTPALNQLLIGNGSGGYNLVATSTLGLQPAGTYVTNVAGSGNISSSGGTSPNITLTGVIPVSNGGLGTTTLGSLTAGTGLSITGGQNVLIGTSTSVSLGPNVVTSVTSGTNVTGSISNNSLTLGWQGQLSVPNGGTGASVLTGSDILFGNGTSAIATSSLFTFTTATGLTVNATSTLATTTIATLSVGTAALPTAGVATFNGNVGIGTSSPTSLLTLQGTISTASLLSVSSTSGSSVLYVANNGYMGVGTSNPQRNLDVTGSNSTTTLPTNSGAAIGVTNTNTTNNNFADLTFLTNDVSGTTLFGAKISGVFTSHAAGAISSDLAFLTRNAGVTSEKLRITAAGNIGVGTITPQDLLQIQAPASYSSDLFDVSTSSGSSYLHVSSSGNVGIGTTLPQSKLDINGNADIAGNLTLGNTVLNQTTGISTPFLNSVLAYTANRTGVGGTAATAYGDSITVGYPYGVSAPGNGYAALISTSQAWTLINLAVAGSQLADWLTNIWGGTVSASNTSFMLTGYNDMRFCGSVSACQTSYQNNLMSMLAYLAIPDANKVKALGAVTYAGSWSSASGIGTTYTSSNAGDTAAFTVSGTGLIIDVLTSAGGLGLRPFAVSVDGVVKGTFTATAAYTDGAGFVYGMYPVIITGLSNGSHSVVLTLQGGTGQVYFSWAAGIGGSLAPNSIFVGNTLKMNSAGYAAGGPTYNNGSDAAVTSFNSINSTVVSTLAADGLVSIKYVDANSAYNLSTDVSSDNIHPNNLGASHIANAFLVVMTSGGAVSSTWTDTSGSSQCNTPNDLWQWKSYGGIIGTRIDCNGYLSSANISATGPVLINALGTGKPLDVYNAGAAEVFYLDQGGQNWTYSLNSTYGLNSLTGGSAAAPGVAFGSATSGTRGTNGMFYPAISTLGFSTNGLERVRIGNTGNVGIGTTAPASLLYVQNMSTSSTGGLLNVASSTGTSILYVANNGNVGIGTTSPSYLLHVGNSSVSGIVARFQNSNGTCDVNPTTGTLACSSDARLKKNITPMGDDLSQVMALQPVYFNWNGEGNGTAEHPGFIAQQVQQVMPEVVSTDPTSGLLSIGYSDLVPALVSAMQQMQTEITTLQGGLNGNASSSNLTVYVPSNFSGDSVGEAEIPAGQTSVRVSFSEPYAYQPIVTADVLDVFIQHEINSVTSAGFTISIPAATTTDMTFDWHSFASPSEQLTVSGGTTQPIVLVAANSAPVSDLQLIVTPDSSDSSSTPPTEEPGPLSTSTPAVLGTSTPAAVQVVADSTSTPATVASSSDPSVATLTTTPVPTPTPTPIPTPSALPVPSPSPTPSPAATTPPTDAGSSTDTGSGSGSSTQN
jgi:hypothetical protein